MKRWIQKGTSFSVKSICQMNASIAFFWTLPLSSATCLLSPIGISIYLLLEVYYASDFTRIQADAER